MARGVEHEKKPVNLSETTRKNRKSGAFWCILVHGGRSTCIRAPLVFHPLAIARGSLGTNRKIEKVMQNDAL